MSRGIGIQASKRSHGGGRFPCPRCQHTHSQCYDSRPTSTGILRRRVCLKCEHRWATLESIAGKRPLPPSELEAVRARLTEAVALIDKLCAAEPADAGGDIIERRLREIA